MRSALALLVFTTLVALSSEARAESTAGAAASADIEGGMLEAERHSSATSGFLSIMLRGHVDLWSRASLAAGIGLPLAGKSKRSSSKEGLYPSFQLPLGLYLTPFGRHAGAFLYGGGRYCVIPVSAPADDRRYVHGLVWEAGAGLQGGGRTQVRFSMSYTQGSLGTVNGDAAISGLYRGVIISFGFIAF